MERRVAARRVYWRWFSEVDLAGGPTLRMTGDAARWLRPGDVVRLRLRAGAGGSVLEFDDYVLEREGRVVWPLWDREVQHPRGGVYAKELYAYRLRIREARYEQDYEAIVALEQYHYASDHDAVAVWAAPTAAAATPTASPAAIAARGACSRSAAPPRRAGSW